MSPRIQRLRAEITSDLRIFQSKVEELQELPDLSGAGRATLAQAAVALHHAYGAIESALSRIARAVDDGLPEGPEWHQSLLHVMCLAVESVRPAVLSQETGVLLQRLLGFRHFFRHAYALDWDGARMNDLRACAISALPLVADDLARFDKFLAEVGIG
jgi:hypothetical protein